MKVLRLPIENKDLQSFGTLSGFLCHKAGCIPPVGTQILVWPPPTPPVRNIGCCEVAATLAAICALGAVPPAASALPRLSL